MTTMHAQPGSREATHEVAGLMLSWDLLPDAPGVRAFVGDRAEASDARLVMEVEGRTISVFVEAVGASTTIDRIRVGAPAPFTMTACGDGVVHIESPGVLRATFMFAPDGRLRPVYARTPLLASLGIPGGSYDRPVVAWARTLDQRPSSTATVPAR